MATLARKSGLLATALLASVVGIAGAHSQVSGASQSLPPVTVTGVAVNNSSAKIDYMPVPGAADYRVLDISNPMTVKYAGMTHLDAGTDYHFVMQSDGVTPVFPYTTTGNWKGSGPQTLDLPGTEIQWNLLDDGLPHTLIVQAVNMLGPVPPHNLTDNSNNPLYPPAGMLGENMGPTPDGYTSINGQGPFTNAPQVIAQSAPFVVQANKSLLALPSGSNALQSFFDTFDTSEAGTLTQVGPVDARNGVMNYTLNSGTPRAWDIGFQHVDTDHSMPFLDGGHFMDVTYDGITPSSLPPGYQYAYHTTYGNMHMSPQTTADLSGGKLLHVTMEVDSHIADFNRWLSFQLAPATDPITNFADDNAVTLGGLPSANTLPPNHSDKALWVQMFNADCDAMLFTGPTSPTNPAPKYTEVVPFYGKGGPPPCYHMNHFGSMALALDNRERWDLFATTTHMALFDDGQLIVQSNIPGGLGFNQAKVYFTHYVYATASQFEGAALLQKAPWESDWINNFQHSDERHWDNMGFEVLPASAVPGDWSTLSSLIQIPASVPIAAPSVTGLAPNSGYTSGGTQVTISGTNFTSATAVQFGSVPAASFSVVSPSQIVATSPAGTAGTVDVVVTTPRGSSPTGASDQFTYTATPPSVDNVSPSTGSTSGGTNVIITGAALSGATSVHFGSVAATSFVVNSPTQITAVSPPNAPGGYDVTVTTAGGTSATSYKDRYRYTASQPSVKAVSPNSGPLQGGTQVTITGTNLYAAVQVWFGGTRATQFTVNSPTQITAISPAHGFKGTSDVVVYTGGGGSTKTPADQFTYTG